MQPLFTYSDVKYAESEAAFQRAVGLFAGNKVTDFHEIRDGYQAIVLGTHPYRVRLSRKRVDYADCDCYLGQNDALCKHMLAVALAALHQQGAIDADGQPTGSAQLSPEDAKLHIAAALRKIRPYDGPSRIWFEYQRKLDTAAGMITEAVPLLEPSQATAKYLWQLVCKLSKKLSHGGVDDSNGAIGGTIVAIINRLALLAQHDNDIKQWITRHCTDDTGFGFEADLQQLISSDASTLPPGK